MPNTKFTYTAHTRFDYDDNADVLYAKTIGKECWGGKEFTPCSPCKELALASYFKGFVD